MTPRHGMRCPAILAALAACAVAPARAQSIEAANGTLELATLVEKVVAATQEDGTTRLKLEPAGFAAPGDEVVFTVTFTNVSSQAADHVRITNPIPAELKLLPNSAFGPGSEVLYSVDDGFTFGTPKELTVATDDGARRAANEADYTHIRWILRAPLEPGAKGFARFRAVVR